MSGAYDACDLAVVYSPFHVLIHIKPTSEVKTDLPRSGPAQKKPILGFKGYGTDFLLVLIVFYAIFSIFGLHQAFGNERAVIKAEIKGVGGVVDQHIQDFAMIVNENAMSRLDAEIEEGMLQDSATIEKDVVVGISAKTDI